MNRWRWLAVAVLLAVAVGPAIATEYTLYIPPAQDGIISNTTTGSFLPKTVVGDTVSTSGIRGAASVSADTSSGNYTNMRKIGFTFATGNALSSNGTATVTSAVLRVKTTLVYNQFSSSCATFGITDFYPTNPAALTSGDYNRNGTTRLSTDIRFENIPEVGSWAEYNLNSDGLAKVATSSGGYTNLSFNNNWSMDGNEPVWESQKALVWSVYFTETTGTSNDPYLIVNYTVPDAPVASFTKSRPVVRIPQSVTMTDTSTNTPTAWQWSWGDGTSNATTQNPSHTYKRPGYFKITLTASNAAGQTAATSWIRVYDAASPYRLTLPDYEDCFDISSLSFSREITEYERTMTIEKIRVLC